MREKRNLKKGKRITMSQNKNKEAFKQTNFYKELMKLQNNLKAMTWKQRIEHIWEYYKEYMFVAGVFLMIIIGLIAGSISAGKETVVTGIMVNLTIDQKGYNYLSTDYAQYIGEKDEEKVRLEYTEFSDLLLDASDENYNAAQVVILEVAAKKLDYMILDKLAMEFYTSQEIYLDLRNFFTLEELQEFAEQDLLVFCLEEKAAQLPAEELKLLQEYCLTEEGADIEYCWPAAVKITDMNYVKDNVTSSGDIYFALAGSTEKLEEVHGIWEYMKAWKAE